METNPFRARPPRTVPSSARPPGRTGASLRGWIAERVAGSKWYFRAPLLVVLGWILVGYLRQEGQASIFDGVTLGFHEMGHAAFSAFGIRILTAAGGTIFQLAIPAIAAAYLLFKQRDPFGAAACLFWLGTSLVQAGVYAGDARAQALPLVSPFGPVDVDSHDWTVMLMKYGMLSKDQAIGAFLVGSGKAAMIGALLAGTWVLRIMAKTPAGLYLGQVPPG